jgi:hypothetical protein
MATTLEELKRNRAYQGGIRNAPRNMFGGFADFLDPLSKFLDQYKRWSGYECASQKKINKEIYERPTNKPARH